MPVSSPSYFPPSRGTDQIVGLTAGQSQTGLRVFLGGQNAGYAETVDDIIALGYNALAGGVTDANAAGSTVIGSGALPVVTNFSGSLAGPNTSFGFNNGKSLVNGGANVFIGDNILTAAVGSAGSQESGNVLIGSGVAKNCVPNPGAGNTLQSSVIIGYHAFFGPTGSNGVINSVLIGSEVCRDSGGVQISACVIIGRRTGLTMSGASNTIIGANSAPTLTAGTDNVSIGNSVSFTGSRCVLIGGSIAAGSGSDNTFVGYQQGTILTGGQNIVLGSQASVGLVSGTVNKFVVGTFVSSTRRAILYGDMTAGNLMTGNALVTQHTLVDTPNGATNILQIPNGTPSGTNPTTSGYFYVTAGALHWVGSAGTDTAIAPA